MKTTRTIGCNSKSYPLRENHSIPLPLKKGISLHLLWGWRLNSKEVETDAYTDSIRKWQTIDAMQTLESEEIIRKRYSRKEVEQVGDVLSQIEVQPKIKGEQRAETLSRIGHRKQI
jgi:hypothetical protein